MAKMTSKTVTMTDIADACGLSHATVSFVLRGRLDKPVSPATRERVFAEAVRMGYQPQRHHRIDASKLKVLFICPEYQIAYGEASFPARVMADLARQQPETQIEFVMTSMERASMMETLYRGVCERQADAVVVTRVIEREIIAMQNHCPVPIIHLGSSKVDGICSINIDDFAIGKFAATHLWEHGHRTALILGTDSDLSRHREKGFTDFWHSRGVSVPPTEIWHDDIYPPSGIAHAKRFLTLEQKPSAIFSITDTISYGFMQEISRQGHRIPDMVSLVSCDNMPYSAWSVPALDTLHLCEKTFADRIIHIVNRRCRKHDDRTTHEDIVPELVVRESVRRLPVW